MEFSAHGTISAISPLTEIVTKSGNSFMKQELRVNIAAPGSQYPNVIAVDFTREAINTLATFKPGDRVHVIFNIWGREYNGKVWNSLSGVTVSPVTQTAPAQATQPNLYSTATPPAPQTNEPF